MSNDNDIKIGLRTVGADAAADEIKKVPDALDKIPESTPAAVDAVEKIPEAAAPASEALGDLSDRLEAAKERAEELRTEVNETADATEKAAAKIKLGKAALVGAGIGAAILKNRIDEVAKAINSIDVENLRKLSPAMAEQAESMKKSLEWYKNPMEAMQRLISGSGVQEAFDDMNEQLRLNAEMAEAQYERVHGKRLESLEAETEAMHDQEESFQRMIGLQNELNGQAASAAQKEVQLAKLKGGDVALAEANAITAQLKADIDTLNGNLAASQTAVNMAAKDEQAAVARLQLAQQKVADGIATAEQAGLADLEQTAKDAGEKSEAARADLNGVLATYQGAHENILRDAEIALESKEQEYAGKTSAAAAKAFDGVDKALRQELLKGPEAIAQIQADGSAVTQAAESKAQEVSAAMETAANATSQAISGVGQSAAQSSAALDRAVGTAQQQVSEALNLMTNNVITALGKIAANGIANANKIAAVENQMRQLYARSR